MNVATVAPLPAAALMRADAMPRPGLAATNDGEVRAECGERLRRRQANAIGGTRNQGSACRSRHSNPRLWPRADDLLDRLPARERGQPLDVIESAARE